MSNIVYSDILAACHELQPSLIYLSVGCAQGYHPRATAQPQQYPPFVAAWSGKKICILIDPCLEQPPYAYLDLGIDSAENVVDIQDTRIYCLRQHFEMIDPPSVQAQYRSDSEKYEPDMAFLHALCDIAYTGKTKLIYQDYTGRITDYLYPISRYDDPERLKANVLFDVTYNDGGCFIDFSKVKILMKPNGDFLHPQQETLVNLRDHQHLLQLYAQKRKSDLGYYIHWYYQILLGNKEARDWCSPQTVLPKMKPLCEMYKTPLATDKASIHILLKTALFDYCASTDHFLTEAEVDEIIESPDQYPKTLTMLCVTE